MTDYRAFRICRVGGHVAFWMLIVSTLFAGGLTWLVADDGGAPVSLIRLPSGSESFVAEDGPITQTAGAPSTQLGASVLEANSSGLPDSFPTFAQISVACAVLFILAAVGEAVLIRRQPRKFVTALVPLLVLAILWYATPGARASVHLDPEVAFIFVLAAIAVREIWFRWAAPTLASPTEPVATEEA